jgi:hypothetical protein
MADTRVPIDSDPREAATLEEACGNGDGTYNAFRLLSWLSAAVSGTKGIPVNEAEDIYKRVKSGKHCKDEA